VSGTQGINDPGNYGSIGVSAPTNVPAARMGSYAWQDVNGNLWMGFGQTPTTNFYRNDLWRFVPDPACSGCSMIPLALFSAPNHICPGTCTGFINLSQNATSFQWTFAGATPSTSTDVSPVNICYNTPGTYGVVLVAINSVTSDTLTLNNYITVYPYPAPQGITQVGDSLLANQGAVSYQWYHNGTLISGATNYYYVAPESGNYNVVATDGNGCEVEAIIFDVVAGVNAISQEGSFAVYPNPFTDDLAVSGDFRSETEISVYNSLGEKVIFLPRNNSPMKSSGNVDSEIHLSLKSLAKGCYWIEIKSRNSIFRSEVLKK
jgi:hypothetical protein